MEKNRKDKNRQKEQNSIKKLFTFKNFFKRHKNKIQFFKIIKNINYLVIKNITLKYKK